jgi:cobaltochelatase CobS
MEALTEFVRVTSAASVDEETVRRIVAEAIEALPKSNGGTVINVAERPEPVTIDGVVHERFDKLIDVVHSGLGAYLYGPPATGKSHAAEAVAEALGMRFVGILACSPDMMPTALRGFMNANGVYVSTAFRDAYENGGVFVIDEIDNAPSAITVGLVNTVMASSSMVFPDGTVRKNSEFRCIVTANTFGTGPSAEFVGRFALDPSTQSRFVRLSWQYSERVDRAVVASSGVAERLVDGVMSAVTRMRENIATAGLRGFVTSREAKASATLLGRGWTWAEVLDSCLIPAGMTEDQRRQILANVRPVSA